MKGSGQTKRGPAEVPKGPAHDRSGTRGTGNEPVRQTQNKLTTNYPTVNESRSRDVGSPGPEAKGRAERGYGMAGTKAAATDDATVSADGRRRVKHIDAGD